MSNKTSNRPNWMSPILSLAMAASLPIGLTACGGQEGDVSAKIEEGQVIADDSDTIIGDEEAEASDEVTVDGDDEPVVGEEDEASDGEADADNPSQGASDMFTEDEYTKILEEYDAKNKDDSGSYVGQWYRCKAPDGYTVPSWNLGNWFATSQMLVDKENSTAYLCEAPDDGTYGDLYGDYSTLSVDRYYSGMSADERIAQFTQDYGWAETGTYDAATGITYRIVTAPDGSDSAGSCVMYGEWNGGVVSINSNGASEEAMHEFMDNFVPDEDPDASIAAWMNEHAAEMKLRPAA